MKNIILIFLINFLILSVSNGQDNVDLFTKENAVKINPIGLGNSIFQLTYERFLPEQNSSILISPSFILKETNNESEIGWEMMVQYRLFLTHVQKDKQKTFLGMHSYRFYTGLYGLYFTYSEDYMMNYWDEVSNSQKNEKETKEVDSSEGGVLLGLQIDITPRILIDFYVGGGIRGTDVTDSFLEKNPTPDYYSSYGVFDLEYQGVKPKLGLLLGITF